MEAASSAPGGITKYHLYLDYKCEKALGRYFCHISINGNPDGLDDKACVGMTYKAVDGKPRGL